MEILLETYHQRQLQIIRLFLDNNNECTTMKIASCLNISLPTVKKDIINLRKTFQEKKGFKSKIDIIQDKAVYVLVIDKNFDFRNFKNLYINESITYHFLKDLILNNVSSPLDFSYEENISYSSLYSRFEKINKIISGFDLTINSNPINKLVGTEQQIRFFAIHFFRYTGEIECWPFTKITRLAFQEKVEAILELVENIFAGKVSTVEKQLFSVLIFVMYARIKNNNFIAKEEIIDFAPYILNTKVYEKTHKELLVFLEPFCQCRKQRERELIWVYALVFTRGHFHAFENQQTNDFLHQKITEIFIHEFETKLKLEEENHLFLKTDIVHQLNALHYQILHYQVSLEHFRKVNINNKKDQKTFDFFAKQLPLIFEEFKSILPEEKSMIFLENIDELVRHYYNVFASFLTPQMFLPPLYIKVESHNGENFSNGIANQIAHQLFHYHLIFVQDNTFDVIITDLNDIEVSNQVIFTYVDPFHETYLKNLDNILSKIELGKIR